MSRERSWVSLFVYLRRAGILTAAGAVAAFGYTAFSDLLTRSDQERRLTVEYLEKSVNKLGSDSEWERIAALYALEGIAADHTTLRPLVSDSLHVFIRKGHAPNHHMKNDGQDGPLRVMPSDAQLAIDILGRQYKANRSKVTFRGERFVGAMFKGDFNDASFLDSTFFGTDFTGGKLQRVDFRGAKFSDWEAYQQINGSFDGFRPVEWMPETSKLHWKRYRYGANFTQADLSGATFNGAGLNGAIFRGAILKDTDFREAAVSGADFTDAKELNLAGACSDGCTKGYDGRYVRLDTCSKPLAPDRARVCR